MITKAKLDELDHRLSRGWKILHSDIEALVAMCRSHPAVAPQLQRPAGCGRCDTIMPCNIDGGCVRNQKP